MTKIIDQKLIWIKMVNYEGNAGFDVLVQNIYNLLKIEWLKLIIQNENAGDYANIFGDLSQENLTVTIWNKAEQIYDMVVENIKEKVDDNLIKEINQNKEKIIKNLKKAKVEEITMQIGIEDIEIIDSNNMNIKEVIDAFVSNINEDNYDFHIDKYYIDHKKLAKILSENLFVIKASTMSYGQDAWDKYYIIFDKTKENIEKIEKQTWLKIEEWKDKVKKYIWYILTCWAVKKYYIYELTIENENWKIIKKQVKKLANDWTYIYYDNYWLKNKIKEFLSQKSKTKNKKINEKEKKIREEMEEKVELIDYDEMEELPDIEEVMESEK